MNQYITGETIKALREKNKLTQLELANILNISDKTVSKWETGKGYPDIEILEPLAKVFNVSVLELLNGNTITNTNVSGNLLKTKFYVCPICGNIINSIGDSVVVCHGIQLPSLEAEENDEKHKLIIETIDNQYFVKCEHPMNKQHYISAFIAVGYDKVEIVKLYPEQNAEAYFNKSKLKYIYVLCSQEGLYKTNLN